jgi:hypothetical protein
MRIGPELSFDRMLSPYVLFLKPAPGVHRHLHVHLSLPGAPHVAHLHGRHHLHDAGHLHREVSGPLPPATVTALSESMVRP